MKDCKNIFTEVLTESGMEPEAYLEDAKNAAEYFNTEVKKLFPKDFYVNARMANIIGPTLMISFANVPEDIAKTHNTAFLNATTGMKFLMSLTDNSGKTTTLQSFPIDSATLSYHLKNNGVKFRKINGKSPMDSIKKLVAWFKKNAEAIKGIERGRY